MKRICLIFAFVSLALCACNEVENNQTNIEEVPGVYHLSIQASLTPKTKAVEFGTDGKTVTTMFEESDNIYVYNEDKEAFARSASGDLIALHPSEIINNTSCKLSGDLSFRLWDGSAWQIVQVDETDRYALYYQLNFPDSRPSNHPFFAFEYQNGSSTNVSSLDFAEAKGIKMKIDGNRLTLGEEVTFTNLQSLFRQRLSFTKDGAAAEIGNIKSLKVDTKNGTLVQGYSPTNTEKPYTLDSFVLDQPTVLSADKDVYLSLAFHYDAEHPAEEDELIIEVTDENGNVYQGAKSVPEGGFVASSYYYGLMTLAWKEPKIKPTVEGGTFLGPDENGQYNYPASKNADPTVVSISGNSDGYYFYFGKNADITLGGGGAAINVPNDDDYYGSFLYDEFGFRIILAGNYIIDCRTGDAAIWADWGNLTLETNTNSSQTLTVIAKDSSYRGLYGGFNYSSSSDFPSALAANNFTVELTSTTPVDEDEDDTPDYYVWVYTISPQ